MDMWDTQEIFSKAGKRRRGENYHCSVGKKGFAISSDPSTGLRTVIVGPRRTVKPRERVWGSGTIGKSQRAWGFSLNPWINAHCSSSVTSSRTRFKS